MPEPRFVIHTTFVLSLPIVVAALGISVWSAALLVLLALLWRWAIVLLGMMRPAGGPELVLETISASHFVEKVRWCMDRLGLEYAEEPWAGTLGAFYRGRTVPKLSIRTGLVRSTIGNSPEILRYLWGAYGLSNDAEFLRPTEERQAFEQRLDRYGRNLQVWVYYHLLTDPALCRHLWGANDPAIAWWQRATVRMAYPLQALLIRWSFRIDQRHYEKSIEHIEQLLADVDARLADGRRSILGDDESNYTDLAFAAMSGLWLQPEGYGGGAAAGVLVGRERMPTAMLEDREGWKRDYPRAAAFVEMLYAEERGGRP